MPDICCPECHKKVWIEGSIFNEFADALTIINCPECNKKIAVWWEPVFEADTLESCGLSENDEL